jgi:hypothetical protein
VNSADLIFMYGPASNPSLYSGTCTMRLSTVQVSLLCFRLFLRLSSICDSLTRYFVVSQMICVTAPGIGSNFVFSVRVGGVWSALYTLSTVAYAPPTVSAVGSVPIVSSVVNLLDT